jgi:Na+-translocating ferredoxin:NAD+ oxidoreductase RnfE subunit
MKFILGVTGNLEPQQTGVGGALKGANDWLAEKNAEVVLDMFIGFLNGFGAALWRFFLHNLPDIMGYGAMFAGAAMILCAMFSKNGMMRPLSYYSAALILAICILNTF